MANLSNLTRREQVYEYLKTRINAWVDGTELATAEVGGSEGLKRLRELRAELKAGDRYDIQMRGHPDPDKDIFQYRLVNRVVDPLRSPYPRPAPAVSHASAEPPTQERPRQSQNAPARRGTHVVYDPETDKYIAVYDGPPVGEDPSLIAEGQVDMGVPKVEGQKYLEMPKRIVLGESIPCPMCHGIYRRVKGKLLSETRHPHHPNQICPRCNGFGLVPNK